jgi:glycosyltransferase involved in cell wall biosynthesis
MKFDRSPDPDSHQNPTLWRGGAPKKICFLASYWPRRCGIATFTTDLCRSIQNRFPQTQCLVAAIQDENDYSYESIVRYKIAQQKLADYRLAAAQIKLEKVDVLCLQHEFGVFGGPAGSHLLALLGELNVPLHTTLHTVLKKPSPAQNAVMKFLIQRSERLVVMTNHTGGILQMVYGVSSDKITVIPHGIPDIPYVGQAAQKSKVGLEGRTVILTFGLLSPGKGIENAIRAVAKLALDHPDLLYVILGATHPQILRESGENYRLSLQALTLQLGIEKQVRFVNRFVEMSELTVYLAAADIYVTPYLNEAQAVSGTLAYAFGCGKAVVSTPYWHARELLEQGRGLLVPFGDSPALARALKRLLDDPEYRQRMSAEAYRVGRAHVWNEVAALYAKSMTVSVGSNLSRGTPQENRNRLTGRCASPAREHTVH